MAEFLRHDASKLHAMLFTGREKLPLLLAQAAHIFAGRIVFGCVLTTETQVRENKLVLLLILC